MVDGLLGLCRGIGVLVGVVVSVKSCGEEIADAFDVLNREKLDATVLRIVDGMRQHLLLEEGVGLLQR